MQLVELRNGETYNGHLVNCDTWMNTHLWEVICTSKVISLLGKYIYMLCIILQMDATLFAPGTTFPFIWLTGKVWMDEQTHMESYMSCNGYCFVVVLQSFLSSAEE